MQAFSPMVVMVNGELLQRQSWVKSVGHPEGFMPDLEVGETMLGGERASGR